MGKGRAPCCDKSKVKRGPWSPQEDLRLINFIQKHGHSNWRSLPNQAGLLRCGKSCRLRWINYLRPDLKRGNFTKEDEEAIIELHHKLGNKWSKIASYFPGRTDNEIKNVWHTHLKKKFAKKEDNFNHHKDEIKELSKSSSFSYSSSSSADESERLHVGISILSPSSNQIIGNGIEGKKQGNKESKEISSSSNSPSALQNCSNSSLTDIDFMRAEDIDFLSDYAYQENYEMFLNPDQDTGSFPLEIDFDFLEMLDKEDPIYTYRSQAKEFEICQSNFGEENEKENECMKWIKNLENELLLETIDGEDQYISQDAYGQFLLSP